MSTSISLIFYSHFSMVQVGSAFYGAAVYYKTGFSANNTTVRMYKTTDPVSGSWSYLSEWEVTDASVNPIAIADYEDFSGLKLTTATKLGAAVVTYATLGGSNVLFNEFDTSTDTWGSQESLQYNQDPAITSNFHVQLDVRSDGDVLVAFNGPKESVHGSPYGRVVYARREGADVPTWTKNLSVSPTGILYGHVSVRNGDGKRIDSSDTWWICYTSTTAHLRKDLSSGNSLGSEATNSGLSADTYSPIFFAYDGSLREAFALQPGIFGAGTTIDVMSMRASGVSGTVTFATAVLATYATAVGVLYSDLAERGRGVVEYAASGQVAWMAWNATADSIYLRTRASANTWNTVVTVRNTGLNNLTNLSTGEWEDGLNDVYGIISAQRSGVDQLFEAYVLIQRSVSGTGSMAVAPAMAGQGVVGFLFAQDNFTETVDTTLDAHTPDLGAPWMKRNHASYTAAHVDASVDRVTSSDLSNNPVFYVSQAESPDANVRVSARCYVSSAASAGKYRAGVAARVNGTPTAASGFTLLGCYVFGWNELAIGGGTWLLQRWDGASFTTIDNGPTTPSPVGTERTIMLLASGSAIDGYVDGVLVCSAVDTTYGDGITAIVLCNDASMDEYEAVALTTSERGGRSRVTATYPILTGTGDVGGGGGISGSGSLAVTAAMSGSAAQTQSGSGAMAVPSPAMSGAGTQTQSGTGTMAVAVPAMSGTGTQVTTGTGTLAVPQPVLAATGTQTQTASGTLAVAVPVLAATGAQAQNATGSMAVGAPTLTATGTTQENITASGSLAVVASISGTGTQVFTGTATLAVPSPAIAGTGSAAAGASGSGTLAVAVPTLAATGTHQQNVTATGTLAVVATLAGAGAQAQSATGSMAVVAALSATGTTQQNVTASGVLTVASPALAAEGVWTPAGVTASGALAITTPTLSASGTQAQSASGSMAVVATVSGTGTQAQSATGTMAVTATLAATGATQQNVTASGALAVAPPTLAAAGAQGYVGSGALAVTATLAAIGTQAQSASGALAVDASIAGAGTQAQSGTGALALTASMAGTGGIAGAVFGTGVMAVPVPTLAGTAAQAQSASGVMAVPVPALSGSGSTASAITGTGTLSVTAAMSGTLAQAQSASGALTITLGMVGTAGQVQSASGALAITAPTLAALAYQTHTASGIVTVAPPSLAAVATMRKVTMTGTLMPWTVETNIKDTGGTLVLTLTGDTWIP